MQNVDFLMTRLTYLSFHTEIYHKAAQKELEKANNEENGITSNTKTILLEEDLKDKPGKKKIKYTYECCMK